eukprot:4640721-Prymnesium_polylepis.1
MPDARGLCCTLHPCALMMPPHADGHARQLGCVNRSTGLVDFRACPRQTAGLGAGSEASLRDIVDWPPVARDSYVLTSAANTVINAY